MTLREAIDALLNEFGLEDFAYDVRDRAMGEGDFEGNSWDHPKVKRFSDVLSTLKAWAKEQP